MAPMGLPSNALLVTEKDQANATIAAAKWAPVQIANRKTYRGIGPAYRLFLKQRRVRPCAHEVDDVALDLVDQQEVAADVAFTVVGPFAL